MTKEKELLLTVKEAVGLGGNLTMKLLTGDASTRKYYRVNNDTRSIIVVVSEPFPNNDPAIISNFAFKVLNVPVPSILKVLPEKGVMIKEDLGNTHLQDIRDIRKLFEYYNMAVNIMISYQLNGLATQDELFPLSYSFTKEKFLSELNMTTEYYLQGYRGIVTSNTEARDLFSVYEDIVNRMMTQKKLLLHRDYHSRNLMISNEHLYVIDYQDARLGPYTYDLASLVIDPYIELSTELRDKIIKTYYDGVKGVVKETYDDFKQSYDLCFLQRGIKILGTFAYQKLIKNTDRYLGYIKPSENKIKEVLNSFPEWQKIITGVLLK